MIFSIKPTYLTKENIIYFLTIVVSYFLLIRNRLINLNIDESDNLTAGWLISQDYILYKDIFSHHMPVPYFFSGLLSKIGLDDFESMRIGISLMILLFWIIIIAIFKNKINYKVLCLMIILFSLAHPFFSGNAILADNFFAYAVLILFLYAFLFEKLNFSVFDKIVISIIIYFALFSTIVAVYPLIIFGIYYIYKKISELKNKKNIQKILFNEIKFFLLITVLPFLTLFYFYLNSALLQFYQQAFLFNFTHYAKFIGTNLPVNFFENIKIVIFYFFNHIFNIQWFTTGVVFLSYDDPNPTFIEGFLIITNFAALIVYYKKRGIVFLIFYLLFLGSLVIRNTFYHLTPYFLLSFFNIGLILTNIYAYLKNKGGLIYLIKTKLNWHESGSIIYLFLFFGIFLGQLSISYSINSKRTINKTYYNYYNYFISSLTEKEDKIWVAPLEPLFYLENKRIPASRHIFYLPWQADSAQINQEIIDDLTKNKPPVIIFEKDTVVWNDYKVENYGHKVYDFIKKNYQPLDETNKDIYLINEKREKLLKKLTEKKINP